MKKCLIVDDVEYEQKSCGHECLGIIVVDNRGLMFVGYFDLSGDSEWITIRKARCVINWGTITEHVAGLCDGPRESTKLGKSRDVIVRRENIQFAYENISGDWFD